ncbi:MAG: hypothetical protein ACON4T_01375 [Synechococcus sp.]
MSCTIEALGDDHFRVCGNKGCMIVKGWSNAQYLSRNNNNVEPQSRFAPDD